MIRAAKDEDWDFWHGLDPQLPYLRFRQKARDREEYVLFAGGTPAAVLRFQLFQDRIPCCTHLMVDEGFRGQALGQALLAQWEQDMLLQGFDMAMVSAPCGGEAQACCRAAGYRDTGCLVMDLPGHVQPMELFMVKALHAGCACGGAERE